MQPAGTVPLSDPVLLHEVCTKLAFLLLCSRSLACSCCSRLVVASRCPTTTVRLGCFNDCWCSTPTWVSLRFSSAWLCSSGDHRPSAFEYAQRLCLPTVPYNSRCAYDCGARGHLHLVSVMLLRLAGDHPPVSCWLRTVTPTCIHASSVTFPTRHSPYHASCAGRLPFP